MDILQFLSGDAEFEGRQRASQHRHEVPRNHPGGQRPPDALQHPAHPRLESKPAEQGPGPDIGADHPDLVADLAHLQVVDPHHLDIVGVHDLRVEDVLPEEDLVGLEGARGQAAAFAPEPDARRGELGDGIPRDDRDAAPVAVQQDAGDARKLLLAVKDDEIGDRVKRLPGRIRHRLADDFAKVQHVQHHSAPARGLLPGPRRPERSTTDPPGAYSGL